jgi:hypothetical protein
MLINLKDIHKAAEELRNFKYDVQEVHMTNSKGKLFQYVTWPICLRDPVDWPTRPVPPQGPRQGPRQQSSIPSPSVDESNDFMKITSKRTPDVYSKVTESTPPPPPCQIKKNGYAEITKDFLSENKDKTIKKLYPAGLIGFVKAFDGEDLVMKFKDGTFTIINKSYVCNVEKPMDWDTK